MVKVELEKEEIKLLCQLVDAEKEKRVENLEGSQDELWSLYFRLKNSL